ncbi:phage portal protein [Klebsiella pneumoniae]|uniref:phage portal protein n=1 Tax=Klebsiella pneumoniae TaxID=573 RepID=UPI00065A0FFC|nr:phage portal protein [Klebsiella pneumoniae]KME78997.1 hypothetical protein SM12_01630 [Klebsiella pneumoniae]MCM5872638.1 phage portal protein [Klebsiella pneumoniae]
MKLFSRKKTTVKKVRKSPKLVIDNSKSFEKGLDTRQLGPRIDRLSGDFEENLIRTATINNEIRSSGDNLRAMSRTLSINTPYGKRAVQYQVDNVIGEGINPQPRIIDRDGRPKKELNSLIADSFEYWASSPKRFSRNKRLNWRRFQELVERARVVDGETFIRIHEEVDSLRIEIIEAARCKFGDREKTEDGYILDGIEYDEDDAPIRYWFTDIDKRLRLKKVVHIQYLLKILSITTESYSQTNDAVFLKLLQSSQQ